MATIKTAKRKLKAICPSCGVEHKVFILWSGSGVPRIYCKSCKEINSGIYNYSDYRYLSGDVLTSYLFDYKYGG